jgi:ferrochelatase
MEPYTDYEYVRLAKEGKKRLLVITPAFITDCLETLEEIQIRGAEDFKAAGGEWFGHVPCLNDQPMWIDFLAQRIQRWQRDGNVA